ncbi:MAG TPA: hypothetical protein DEA96_16345 [Leptospiraceae bacterium]|nr:hypothetical protein [Spirochaetaceae bacterium]HBS06540.1 hypothetical protein [Leptospiraceae bacterium]|tara:strand:- start:7120 stop:8226 length:1107 start_codon:yes stop_codon:yes gene_type:complete
MKKKLIFGMLALLAFLGASITIYEVKTYRIDRPLELRLDVSGIKEAQAAENAWGGVRQSVTWANANSSLIDSVLTGLNNAGFFQWPNGITVTRVNVSLGTFTGKIQLNKNASATYNITCSACGSAQGFKHRLIIWRQSDDAQALELYFNDYGDTTGSGALVIYRTQILNPTQFNGSDTYVESWVVGSAGSRRQTYSWRDGPLASGGATDRARIFLEEMDGGALLCVKAVIRLNSSTASQISSSIPQCNTTPLYYTVAYGQKTASPFQTTAKVAIWRSADYGTASTLCGTAHNLDFGLFNGNGFIEDGVALGNVPSDFRSGSAINTLFSQIITDTGNAYENLRESDITALDATTVRFFSGATAPTGNSP